MAFSASKLQLIQQAISSRVRNYSCVLCQNTNWSLSDQANLLSLTDNIGSITLGGNSLPLVAMTCTNCGNTHFINLAILGLLDQLRAPDQPSEGANS